MLFRKYLAEILSFLGPSINLNVRVRRFLIYFYLGIMFDEAGDIVPVLVGPEAARVGGDPHYHTFDGNTVHYQGIAHFLL